MTKQPASANDPVPVEDWRTAALQLYTATLGYRCIRCFQNIDKADERTLYVQAGLYMLAHLGDCPSR